MYDIVHINTAYQCPSSAHKHACICIVCCTLSMTQALPRSSRPMYSCSMEGLVLCFTGFKDKAELSSLCSQAHFMGASIRGDINSAVTHIIAHSVSGSKYKVWCGSILLTSDRHISV